MLNISCYSLFLACFLMKMNSDVILALACLWVRVYFPLLASFKSLFLLLIFCSLSIIYIVIDSFWYSFFLMFFELLESVVYCLLLILENSWALSPKILLLLLSFLILFLIVSAHVCYIFSNHPTVIEKTYIHMVLNFSCICFSFWFEKFLLAYLQYH